MTFCLRLLSVIFSLFFLISLFAAPAAGEITLFYSNDAHGATSPCGCRSNQLGGLAKRKTLFQQLNLKEDSVLLLDAGALLFNKSKLPAGRHLDLAKINAAGIVESYNSLGYEAVGVSRIDLAGGVDFLKQLAKQSDFTWLSANLVDRQTRQLLFPPFIIKKKNGLRIAVIGLTGSGVANEPPEGEHYLILPWQDLLPKYTKEISKQAELVILLSSLSSLENQQITREFPQIHIIIQAGMYSENQQPVLANNALICQAEMQGKYIGELRINWVPNGRWTDAAADAALMKRQEHDRLTWQIKKLESRGDPKVVFQDAPATLQAYHKLVERRQGVEREIVDLRQKMSQSPASSTFANAFLAVEPTIADDPDLEKIIMKTRDRINDFGKSGSSDGTMSDYVGSQACLKCHEETGRRWLQTPHAHAYKTLVRENQQLNTDCLPCHVTGVSILDKQPALALSLPDSLRNVGCETCHGPGMAHTIKPEEAKLNKSPDAYLCLQCHSSEHDKAFHFEQDRKLVH
ncbi:MAG: UshA-like (seleno)protein [Thermodesulfobacteriota bacterium]